MANSLTAAVSEASEAAASYSIAVLAYKGTSSLMAELWSAKCSSSIPFKTMEVTDDYSWQDALAALVADEEIADDFCFIPANTVPCAVVTEDILSVPWVFTTGKGDRVYAGRVPHLFTKYALVELFASDPNGKMSDEEFMKAYYKAYLGRPVEVGFKFGNFVTPVLRGNPCEFIVIEAVVRKLFISASPEGFAAISTLLKEKLL